jgi:hypothetical protein
MSNPARCTAIAIGWFFVSVTAPAGAEMDDDGTTPLESADTGSTHSLDAVDTGRTHGLDSVDTGHTHSLDSVDTGRTQALDSVDTGRTNSLDSVATGHTNSLDAVEAARNGWSPPACGGLDVVLGATPDGADVNAWSDVLFTAQKDLGTSKYRLKSADDAYARAVSADYEVGSVRAHIIEARDEARANYARSRCALPELVERARRAGVEPGVLRRYEELPADID